MVSTPPVSIHDPWGPASASPAPHAAGGASPTPVLSTATTATTTTQQPRQPPHVPELMVPMLDGREVLPSPVGRVAELVSESTARCREEMCPAPVELPDSGASWLEPVPVPNLVNQYPVELPALQLGRKGGEEQAPGSRVEGQKQQQDFFMMKGREGARDLSGGLNDHVADLNLRRPGGRPGSSTQAQPPWPPRPPKVKSISDPPSHQAQPPKIPPKIPHDEWLHQEILDFFPDNSQVPRPLQIGTAKPASAPVPGTDARRLSMPSSGAKLGPVPSILRPGPRRSSQPARPDPGAGTDTRRFSHPRIPDGLRPGMGMHAASKSPPRGNPATYTPYQPLRPLNMPAAGRTHSSPIGEGSHTFAEQCAPLRPQSLVAPGAGRTQSSPDVQMPHGGSSTSIDQDVREGYHQPLRPQKKPPTGRPHAQSLVERPRDPAPWSADVPLAVMPDHEDHMPALRLSRRSTLHAMMEEEGLLSSPPPASHPHPQQATVAGPALHNRSNSRASMYFAPGGQGPGQLRTSPVKFVVPAPHSPPDDAPGLEPEPEPSSFVRMPSARASLLCALAQRPLLPLKIPSEPAMPTGGGGGVVDVQPHEQPPVTRPAPVTSQSSSAGRSPGGRDSVFDPLSPPGKIEETVSSPERQTEQASSASSSASSSSNSTPVADEKPPGSSERRPTSLSQLEGAGGSGDKSLKNMLRRIARPGGGGGRVGEGDGGVEPIQVVGEEEEELGHSPMCYIPPKGKRGQAAEWSWGHAE